MQTELIEIKLKIIEKIVAKIHTLNNTFSFDEKINKMSFEYQNGKNVEIEKASHMFLIYINDDFICAIKKDNHFFNVFNSFFEKAEYLKKSAELEKFNGILNSLD